MIESTEDVVERLSQVRELVESGRARSIRRHAHVRKAELARAVDVAPSTIHRWEAGTRSPRGERALRYLAVLERLRDA